MGKIPVSVCIIAKNEEKYIEGCLQRLIPYGFEIVVADTGSTDRTKEIAAKYADKVVDFPWVNDFSAARNYCASCASHNWILSLDCDEYVENIDIQNLRIIMQKCKKYIGIIRLKNLIYTETGEKRYTSDDVSRFYNKNYFHYEASIHEQLCPIKKGNVQEPTISCVILPMEVVHHGYLISKEEMAEKQKRNLQLLHQALGKEPDNPYLYFQIGQSEFILDHYEQAIESYEKGLTYDVDPSILYVEMMIEGLATTYMHADRFQDAVHLIEKYQGRCKTAKYAYVSANIYMDNEMPIKALLNYIKAVSMPNRDSLGEGLLKCYEMIIHLYREMGNEEMANLFVDKYQTCVKERDRILNNT